MISKNNILRTLVVYIISFLMATILFILLFHVPNSYMPVLFYKGILLLFLVAILLSIILIFLVKKNKILFTYKDIFVLVSIFISFNLVFFTLLPVTIERSISVFILKEMSSNPNNYFTTEQINDVFIKKYVYENKAIDKRFNEQLFSGNIIKHDKLYSISNQGKIVMSFFYFIGKIFNVESSNLRPK